MADNQNFAALDWVVDEIDETLKQAQQALEAFVENPQDSTRIRFCLTHIHQVHGSLKMVEFFGAALLAEEMEALTQALMNAQVGNQDDAYEVLMRAILQLPIYLEQIRLTRNDTPGNLLPLLNDLRAVRGASLLTESKFFSPKIDAARRISGVRNPVQSDAVQFNALLIKLRKMYQYAAAGVLRGVNAEENIDYLKKVFSRLAKLTEGTARQPLWNIAWAVVEGIEADGIEISAAVKNLLRKLDAEIQVLLEQGAAGLNTFTRDELIKNLLYYVASSSVETPRISLLREQFALQGALPSQGSGDSGGDMLGGPAPETIRTVVLALNDELESIKHALDVGISGDDHAAVNEALPIMQRVADTLAVLGVADIRKKLLEHVSLLQSQAGEPSADILMNVAGDIITMEQQLAAIASGTSVSEAQQSATQNLEISQAQESVLREARNGLEQAKDAIIEYIASQWDQSHLQNVPKLLNEIRGGLSMIPLARPAEVLKGCSRFVEQKLLSDNASPEWSTLDTLADAIASVEYYLERLSGDSEEDGELLLDLAEESVASLGYGLIKAKRSATKDHSKADVGSVLGEVEEVEIEILPEQLGTVAVEEDVAETAASEESVESVIETLEEPVVFESLTETQEKEPEVAAVEVVEDSIEGDDDEDVIDDEILEIFIEEAGEVLEAIDEYFPRWAADFDDVEALAEFRRAFHTLKGSGRMVGANDLAELAWSVENMINRVMDESIAVDAVQADFIRRVRTVIPEFITAFEQRQPNPQPEMAAQLMAWGKAIARGEQPEGMIEGDLSVVSEELVAKPENTVVDEQTSNEALIETETETEADVQDDEDNAILWEIFGGEALSHLAVTESFIAEMEQAAPLYTPPTAEVQRALHTLKGSAHMADLTAIAQLATPLERFVKELRIYQVDIDDDILQLLRDGVTYTRGALEQIKAGETVTISKQEQFHARVAELKNRSVGPLIRQQEESKENKVDPELLSIFMAEEMNLLLDSDVIVASWQLAPSKPEKIESVINELNLLARGASRAGLPPMGDLSQQLADIYSGAKGDLSVLDESSFTELQAAHESLLDMIDAIAAGQNVQPVSEQVNEQLAAVKSLFVAQVEGSDLAPEILLPEIETFETFDEQEQEQEQEVELEIESESEPEVELEIEAGSEAGLEIEPEVELEIEAESETGLEIEPVEIEVEPEVELEIDAEPEVELDIEAESEVELELEDQAEAIDETIDFDDAQEFDREEDLDPEIIEIFIEEADELMEDIEQSVHQWEEDWNQTDSAEELKRALHTLKGGARLSGVMGLGDLAHDFETDLINMGENAEVSQAFFTHIHRYQDQMLLGLEQVKASLAEGDLSQLAAAGTEVNTDDSLKKTEPFEAAPTVAAPPEIETNVVPFAPKDQVPVVTSGDTGSDFQVPPPQVQSAGGPAPAPLVAKRSAPQEVVKISAELLETLVNLAGETSISRGRLEEQVSELGFSLEEMDSTILRLQEQLRRLDIETQAQVAFRQEQLAELEEFDPLEMDRYSHLQQLSRSLIESASDLLDIKSTLGDKTRDAETLLLQQSRINTELQEGLMRSRMVPFSRLVPRLRRIVRQVSTELNKQVSFELDNIEGELDRTVLERMVAPLEHMLRNAVDHGIENAEDRLAAGKGEAGRIVLTLGREGGDVILRLVDDGRGINLPRVREKAIERGLMTADASLSDSDVMQFILNAGFSTAENVSQISGRGVGMDVVNSEIKQLGGAMSINSREGEGTEFTIRLPFTVSVNRALMVRIGDDRYAIPLNAIEGIVRISPFELEHYYSDPEARFEYAGENYQVKYLGAMLHSDNRPKLEGQAMPLPVVLVRSAQHAIALQVDILMGSREIVVKSMGPQFGQVHAVSGATVMGDGSVVVIIDPLAMIRQEAALAHLSGHTLTSSVEPETEVVKTVMVVDDSVTVRKVTTRFLEREGFEVFTAKDGADALMVLQDRIPDVMLLDIEMPRMDGFEVAKNVRSSSRLKDIPIIMITSRTGEKHRQHALSLGVNQYMGKPFQEEILLKNILSVTGNTTETDMP